MGMAEINAIEKKNCRKCHCGGNNVVVNNFNGGGGHSENESDVVVATIIADEAVESGYTCDLTATKIGEHLAAGKPVIVKGTMDSVSFNTSDVMFHTESGNAFAYITTPAGVYKMTIGATGEVEIEAEGAADATELLVETTWAELKALRDGGNLVAGQHYRITDYQCTTSQANTQSAGHQFDIIVVADDESTLNENARAIMHDGDQHFTGCKLSAWKLLYCLDNDSSRFAWAQAGSEGGNGSITFDVDKNYVTATFVEEVEDGKDHYLVWSYNDGKDDVTVYTAAPCSVGDSVYSDSSLETLVSTVISMEDGEPVPAGKGVIYRMVDEYLNDLPYDFKNIQFRRWAITDITNDNLTTEALSSLQQSFVKSQNNGLYFAWSPEMSIYGCTATVDSSDSTFYYTFGGASDQSIVAPSGGTGCYCNSMKRCYEDKGSLQTLNANVFLGSNCHSNTFGNNCDSNTFGNDCYYNTFGNNCHSNTFGNSCNQNTFGNYCYRNTFGNDCYYNTFGNSCNQNTFGNGCWNNTFGNNCYRNTFGNGCWNNTFGNDCKGNTFGNGCWNNTFGNDCWNNTFGNGCWNNTFGNNCDSNTFGNYFQNNTFGNYVRQLTVFDGVMCCAIVGGSDSSSYVQNAQILNGTKGDNENNLLTITFVANSNSTQCAAKNSSGTLKVWYAADLVA